jgi:hypothetical protein
MKKTKDDLLSELSQLKACRKLWNKISKDNEVPNVSRQRKHVIYRHSFLKAVRKHSTLSLSEIGNLVDKDHATVLHACKQHETNYKFDSTYKSVYYLIDEMVREELMPFNILEEHILDDNLYKNKAVRERLIKLASQNRRLIISNSETQRELEALKKYVNQVNKENSALRTKISSVAW